MKSWIPKIFWSKPDEQGLEGIEGKRKFTLKELKIEVQSQGVNSQLKYHEVRKKYGWPSQPHKLNGWKNWADLFGKENLWDRSRFPETLQKLKSEVRVEGINLEKDYHNVRKTRNWPTEPQKIYENWKGWPDLFGRESHFSTDFFPETLDLLKIKVRAQKVKSVRGYKLLLKENRWPTNPNEFYKNKGWISWRDLFGTEKIQFPDTLLELKKQIQEKGVTTYSEYFKLRKVNGWPAHPMKVYKDWVSWDELLERAEGKIWTLAELKESILNTEVRSQSSYHEHRSRYGWPANPSKLEGWENWYDLFGKKNLHDQDRYPKTLESLKTEVVGYGIDHIENYRKNASERNWPTQPEKFYHDWKGWPDLFGRENLFDRTRFPKTLDILKAEVNLLGINLEKDYHEIREEQSWPSTPQTVYPDWKGWPDLFNRGSMRQSKLEIVESLEKLNSTILDLNTPEGKMYQNLVDALGPEGARDLLYGLRPESMKIPVGALEGHLAKYIGEYQAKAQIPVGEVINQLIPLLSHLRIRELTLACIKRECQEKYFKIKKASDEPDEKPVREFFAQLRLRIKESTPECQTLLKEAEVYFYEEMLGDVPLPDKVVSRISAARPFPDIYQRINVNEIRKNDRFLIADEMGVGKSASAILAKESLGKKCALVVVPSVMVSTWSERYLTDKVNGGGKQEGYFKPGQAPKVLVIKEQTDLEKLSTEEYDYVVISKEKLNDNYTPSLQKLDFDMLIVDEVHQYKRGQRGTYSRNLLALSKKIDAPNKKLVLLSGTPVPNKVEDVAMLLKLLHPEVYGDSVGNIATTLVRQDILAPRLNLLPLMQMKRLEQHIEMPKLSVEEVPVQLTSTEEEGYENILQTDDFEPQVKMGLLRKFLLHSEVVMDVPVLASAKIEALNKEISEALKTKKKIVIFVNDYIENVMRGDDSIVQKLRLPTGTQTFTIHGEGEDVEEEGREAARTKTSRDEMRKRFEETSSPSVLFLSGKTDAVGVDYSFADHIIFYNQPWNMAEFGQQLSRVYRPGLKKDLSCRVLITKNTLEEGISQYIQKKQVAINKLLKGIPLTKEELDMLQADTDSEETEDLNVDPNLSKHYESKYQRIMKYFGWMKERGEKHFFEVLTPERQKEYAEIYELFGGRSYQDNAARVSASLIRKMSVEEKGNGQPFVLDMGSGPAMLRRHMLEYEQSEVVSIDLLRSHFEGKDLGMTAVGSMADNPFPDGGYFDFVNMSLCIQDTAYSPEESEYERIFAFTEAARVLKTGGRLLLNMGYTFDFRDEKLLSSVLEKFGLKLVPHFTGEVDGGENYKSRVLVFEKTKDLAETPEQIISTLTKEELKAFYLLSRTKQKEKIKSRGRLTRRDRVIPNFTINDKEVQVQFNREDERIYNEEQRIIAEVEEMKRDGTGGLNGITRDLLIHRGYARLVNGKNSRLFKKIPGDGPITLD